MGHTASLIRTRFVVGKLARKETVWVKAPLKVHAHDSPVVVMGGPLDQTERRREDNWSSSQTPSCCKVKNQTRLSYPGTRVV